MRSLQEALALPSLTSPRLTWRPPLQEANGSPNGSTGPTGRGPGQFTSSEGAGSLTTVFVSISNVQCSPERCMADAGWAGAFKSLDSHCRRDAMDLDQVGADQETGPVKPVMAVDPDLHRAFFLYSAYMLTMTWRALQHSKRTCDMRLEACTRSINLLTSAALGTDFATSGTLCRTIRPSTS